MVEVLKGLRVLRVLTVLVLTVLKGLLLAGQGPSTISALGTGTFSTTSTFSTVSTTFV